jgi:long-chain acyl-CoA synthetase
MGRENLLEFFRDYFNSDAEYLVYDDGYRRWTYSYGHMANAARVFADRLIRSGATQGERILLWSESRPEWLAAFWGSLLVGAVVVPIGAESSLDFVRKVSAIVEPKVIALGDDVPWDSVDSGDAVWRLTAQDWTQAGRSISTPGLRASDLAEIVFTSGSTGEPKGVEITHGNLLSQVESVEPALRFYRRCIAPAVSARLLQLLPLSHMFGQVTTLGLPPVISASVVITRRQSPMALVNLIRQQRISAAVCVPRLLEALQLHITSAVPEAAGAVEETQSVVRRVWRYRRVHRMFGWRFIGFLPGGAPLDPKLEDFWAGLGYIVAQGYGLTETSPVVTLNHPLRPRKGSVGRALPGVEVQIAGDGEILVRGPNVTPGYYRQPDQTAEALRDGWFHTGDLGGLDRGGYLYIRGRKREVIVTAEGLNVFPEDVERVLDSVPGVRESAVIGLREHATGNGAGEQVHAVVILEEGADRDQILSQANRQLEAHQRIRGISVWPDAALPRTPQTGKLRRRQIRERVAAPSPPPAQAVGECSPGAIQREIERRTGRRVSPETRLDDLGLSSIDRVEVLLEFERRCQREIGEAEFSASQTVGHLEEVMQHALAGQEKAGEDATFPRWNRKWPARAMRHANLALWILPLTRTLAKPVISGVEKLAGLDPPVIFAANHQSHLDTPLILATLPARWRYRVAPAMYKEYFAAYFHPGQFPLEQRLSMVLQYYLVALLFNGFPIPQQEAGVLDVLRYAGDLLSDGWSLLIFPEGERRPSRQMGEFQPGVGLLAARLNVPVVPIHLEGVDHVLPRETIIPRPGRTRVTFGDPIRPHSEEPQRLAHKLEEAVEAL